MAVRHGAIAALVMFAAGCGPEPEPELVRVAVHGTREGEPLELEDDGTVHLDNDADVYAALVRIGQVSLRSASGDFETESPVNVDLFEGSIVFDEHVEDTIDTVGLSFPEPPGDGVTPGESLSVFVAGLIDDTPFEYRDTSMMPVELSVATPTSRVIDVHFDLKEWFKEVEERELTATGAVILIDDTHNTAAARAIEAAIRSSLRAFSGELPHDDDHS